MILEQASVFTPPLENVPLPSRRAFLDSLGTYAREIYPFRLSMSKKSLRGFRKSKAYAEIDLLKKITSAHLGVIFPYYVVTGSEMPYFDSEGTMSITYRSHRGKIRKLVFVSDEVPEPIADLWAMRERMLIDDDYRCSGKAVLEAETTIMNMVGSTPFFEHIAQYIELRLINLHDRMFAIEMCGKAECSGDRLIKDLSFTARFLREKAREHGVNLANLKFALPKIPYP